MQTWLNLQDKIIIVTGGASGIGLAIVEELLAQGANVQMVDIHGAMVETNMSEKTLSIEMNKLKQARYSIGIAMSEEKYSGIVGALRGKYINCLVTNSSTAELLLK